MHEPMQNSMQSTVRDSLRDTAQGAQQRGLLGHGGKEGGVGGGGINSDGILDDDIKVLVLSDADRVALNAQASRGLLLALAAQGAMGLAAAVIAGVVGGAAAGWSALAGAGAYFIPNALFALRLAVSVRAGKANPFTFLSGELIKLFATALLLWMLSRVAQDSLVWPAALLGLILTLKGYLLLLMFRKLS